MLSREESIYCQMLRLEGQPSKPLGMRWLIGLWGAYSTLYSHSSFAANFLNAKLNHKHAHRVRVGYYENSSQKGKKKDKILVSYRMSSCLVTMNL